MENAAGHILKSDTVDLQGSFVLDVEQVSPESSKKKTVTSAVPQGRIVENHTGFAAGLKHI